jgi:hypothetical protein
MTDKDTDEMLRLLRRIDYKLKIVQVKIDRDKIRSLLKADLKLYEDAALNIIMLCIQLIVIIMGFEYLTSTKTELSGVAVIGVVGISFVILNSFFVTSKNLYSSYMAASRLKKSVRKLFDRIDDPLTRIQRLDPHSTSIEDLGSNFDDICEAIGIFADELDVDKSERDTPSSDNNRDIHPVDNNP